MFLIFATHAKKCTISRVTLGSRLLQHALGSHGSVQRFTKKREQGVGFAA